jgi:MFS family permease
MLLLNTLLVSLILWVYTFINQQTPVYSIAFLTFLFGFLIALQYSSMNSLAYAEISSHHLSAATSIMSTMQQLAQSFGVAVSAMLIRLFTPATGLLPASVFHHTFAAMALITLFSMFIFMHLKKDDGEQMTKKLASRATPLS